MQKIKIFIVWKIIFNIFKKFSRVREGQILFESFLGRTISGNPYYLYEELIKEKNAYDCYWSVVNLTKYNENYQCVKRISLKYLYKLATSKYIINNSRMPVGYKKKNGQVFIQTWHGTPLKKLAFDQEKVAFNKVTKEKYLKNFASDVKNWDYLLAQNKYSEEIFRSSFRYQKKIITKGYPRNVGLFTLLSSKEKLKDKYKINNNKLTILYVPTFRDNLKITNGSYSACIPKELKCFALENNVNLLYRGHYLTAKIEASQGIIDVSQVDNINELFICSDLLITDYSSVIFDYINLNKPMVFWPYDLEEYTNNLRGFYRSYKEEIPGALITNAQELEKIIEDLEKYMLKYKMKMGQFQEKYASLDSCNSAREVLECLELLKV